MSKRKSLSLEKSFGQQHLDQVYDLIYQSSGAPQEIAQLILVYYPLKVKRIQEIKIINDQDCSGQISHDEETDEIYAPIGNSIRIYDSSGNFLRYFSHKEKQIEIEIEECVDLQVQGNDVYVKCGSIFKVYNKRNGQLLYKINPNINYINKFYLTKTELCIDYAGEQLMYDRVRIRKLATHTKHITTTTTSSISTIETIYRLDDANLVLESQSNPVLSEKVTIHTVEIPPIVNVDPDQQKRIKPDECQIPYIVNGINVHIGDGFLWCGKTKIEFENLMCQKMIIVGDYIWCRAWDMSDEEDGEYYDEPVIHVFKCEF